MFDAAVIVAGAGPAGAVAARTLAAAGIDVILCDKSRFPRDKACGDGLIPDALAALRSIGLGDEVRAEAFEAKCLNVLSPSGIAVEFHTPLQVIPRLVLDRLLVEKAVCAGARFQHVIVEHPITEAGQVIGVTGIHAETREAVQLRAPLTVLATGGDGGVLARFDTGARVSPSGLAVRTYAVPRAANGKSQSLWISLERDLLPGYAWAFPSPNGLLNVGVGTLSERSYSSSRTNLRARLDHLLSGRGVLGGRLGPLSAIGKYRGAPLRTGLVGSSLGRRGLAIIGEAAGTTYSISGEGIGKAIDSGLLLAELAVRSCHDLPGVGPDYAAAMKTRHSARFRAYSAAQKWVARPFLADYVARRANRSKWVHARLAGIITERDLPGDLLSFRALWRLLTRP